MHQLNEPRTSVQHPTAGSPEGLFAARLVAEPSRPLITFYDDATGERAELSGRSLANWVTKTHFYLLDELGLSVGDRVFVALPVHWLAAPILLGCWSAGLHVVSDPTGADVVFADADSLARLAATGTQLTAFDEVVAVSLLSMARSAEPPSGAQDYAAAVRPQPDSWNSVHFAAGPTDPALDGVSRAELAEAASTAARTLQLPAGGRLLWAKPWSASADWISSLLAPLAVTGSVVLIRNADPNTVAARTKAEHVDITG